MNKSEESQTHAARASVKKRAPQSQFSFPFPFPFPCPILPFFRQCLCHHLVSACDCGWYAASRRPRVRPHPSSGPTTSRSNLSIYIWVRIYIYISVPSMCRYLSLLQRQPQQQPQRSRMRVLNEILSAHSKMYYTLVSNGYYDFIMCNENYNKIKYLELP